MSVIGSEICPACGRVTRLVRLTSGLRYAHSAHGDGTCLGEGSFGWAYVHSDEAEAVRRIREQGGERLRLAAHP